MIEPKYAGILRGGVASTERMLDAQTHRPRLAAQFQPETWQQGAYSIQIKTLRQTITPNTNALNAVVPAPSYTPCTAHGGNRCEVERQALPNRSIAHKQTSW